MTSFDLDFLFFGLIGFIFFYVWGSAARASRARALCQKEGNQVNSKYGKIDIFQCEAQF